MRINTKVVSDIKSGKILRREAFEHSGAFAKLMGVSRMLGYQTTTIIGSPAAATETIVATTPGFTPPVDTDSVLLLAQIAFTVGTNGVSMRLRIRQGATAAGTTVGDTGLLTCVAANLVAPLVFAVDTPGIVNNFQYTLTLTIGSGSAASTVSAVNFFAICL